MRVFTWERCDQSSLPLLRRTMSGEIESSTLPNTNVTNALSIPVTADKQPIIWDGNDAHLEGAI